jgi:hypothetical protein
VLQGSWWYIALLLAPGRVSRLQMQVVYCISWALVGFAANEQLRQLGTFSPGLRFAWHLPWPLQAFAAGPPIKQLVHSSMVALATWVVGAYHALQRLLYSLAAPAADHALLTNADVAA